MHIIFVYHIIEHISEKSKVRKNALCKMFIKNKSKYFLQNHDLYIIYIW